MIVAWWIVGALVALFFVLAWIGTRFYDRVFKEEARRIQRKTWQAGCPACGWQFGTPLPPKPDYWPGA